MLGKILGIASIGEALMGISLTKKFVSGFILVLALTIVAAILAGALVIFGLYECHLALIHHGFDSDMAALMTGAAGLLVLLAIIAVIMRKLKLMRAIPLAVSRAEILGSEALASLRAFYKGFSEKSPN